MRRFKCSVMTLLMIAAIFWGNALAWDNKYTHPGIVNKAVDYLLDNDPAYAYLADYSHFNLNRDAELTFLDEGAVKEDYGISPDWEIAYWGERQDNHVPLLSWMGHGYNPQNGQAWEDIPDIHNALQYSREVWDDFQNCANRYFQMGRFCHLITDMAVPAHAHADTHIDGDDLEVYAEIYIDPYDFPIEAIRKPSTNGLAADAGHGSLTQDSPDNFIENVAWRTYYMTSYYGGSLVETHGDVQPDSELKRMFPYTDGGLRYDDGGWFVNDSYVIDEVGNNWIGFGNGMNSDWWECPQDPGYYYIENIDGDAEGSLKSENGEGTVPAVFKIDPFRRISPGDNLDDKLAPNSKIMAELYAGNLNRLASEWVAGFILFAEE